MSDVRFAIEQLPDPMADRATLEAATAAFGVQYEIEPHGAGESYESAPPR